MATQIKLMQSDSVLRPIALKYNLLGHGAAIWVQMPSRRRSNAQKRLLLLKKLKVTRPPNTYLLEISYRSTDPRLAADVANAIAASYIEHTFDIRIRSSSDFSSFMEKRLQALKAKMEKSSLALARVEHDSKTVNSDENIDIFSARLSKLSSEYTNAQTDRVVKEARYNVGENRCARKGVSFPTKASAFESSD